MKFFEILFKCEKAALAILLLVMSVLVFLQVLSRYVFLYPFPWVEELTRYLMIWMTLLGSAVAVRSGKHITVDVLDAVLKKPALLFAYRLFVNLAGIVFSLFLAKYGWEIVQRLLTFPQESDTLRIPFYYIHGSFLVGALLMMLHYVENILAAVRQKQWKGGGAA